jgi:hypothetical protein
MYNLVREKLGVISQEVDGLFGICFLIENGNRFKGNNYISSPISADQLSPLEGETMSVATTL